MTPRPLIACRLLLHFLLNSLQAGLSTARIILQGKAPAPGLVDFRYAPMNRTGAAILGALVTLTPGSTAVDIDPVKRSMLLHLLDTRLADAAIEKIRREFEADLCRLFPEEPPC